MRQLALCIALLTAPTARAAELRVGPGQPYATISAAVNAAVNGDVVLVEPGAYDEVLSVAYKNFTVRANGGTVTWTASLGGSDILSLTGGTVVLEGLSFDGQGQRRGVVQTTGSLTLEGCTFTNGFTVIGGGAVRSDSANLVVRDSTFTGNTVSSGSLGLGGALYLNQTAAVVEDSLFESNQATGTDGWGGAIYGTGAALNLDVFSSTFRTNHAVGSGGAIETAFGAASVVDSQFEGNTATSGAGFVCDQTYLCEVTDSVFSSNVATADGGAFLAYYAAAGTTVSRNLFCGNQSGAFGGAILAWASNGTLENNLFADSLGANGGAVGVYDIGTFSSVNNTYVSNEATLEGGVVRTFYGGGWTSLNDLYAYNTTAGTAANAAGTATLYGLYFSNTPADTTGTLGTGTLTGLDPLLAAWPGGTCTWSDFVPALGSPAIDAGDPLLSDPDGSRSDIGAFGGPAAPFERVTDDDLDGWVLWEDCDDTDATVNPGVAEVCDGGLVDEDCDGLVDNDDPGVTGTTTVWPDADGDGFGDYYASPVPGCLAPGLVDNGDDCNDSNGGSHEGPLWYPDVDGDGLGDGALPTAACEAPPGTVANGEDCNDNDALVGGPTSWFADVDGDGVGDPNSEAVSCSPPPYHVAATGDCDDGNAAIWPGNLEICDGLDNDCDGLVDDQDGDVDLTTAQNWYADADGDGYGTGPATLACTPPPGTANLDGDCEDSDATVNPGAPEVCDGEDNNCNGLSDDAPIDAVTWYVDNDFDGYGDDATATLSCQPPPDAVFFGADCDDNEPAVWPGATEVCDGLDNDCDGGVDVDPVDGSTFWPDGDGDGHGWVDGDTLVACAATAGYAALDDDCDDDEATVHPGAPEICDGLDNDCDDEVDEGIPTTDWWPDADEDGYGDSEADAVADCRAPEGHVDNAGDCDDENAEIAPGLADLPGNGVDEDCDGADASGDSSRDPDLDDTDQPGDDAAAVGCGCTSTGTSPGLPLLAPLALLWLGRARRR